MDRTSLSYRARRWFWWKGVYLREELTALRHGDVVFPALMPHGWVAYRERVYLAPIAFLYFAARTLADRFRRDGGF